MHGLINRLGDGPGLCARGRNAGSVDGGLATIAQRLGDMDPCHLRRAGEIGDRPTDTENPRIAARGQPHRLRRLREQLATRSIGRRDGIEYGAIRLGIGPHGMIPIALDLNRARRGDTRSDRRRPFACGRHHQIGRRHRPDLDVQVDPVEQRPRHLCLIIRSAARRACAGKARIPQMSASARVHRGDQLDAGWKRDVRIGACDADRPGLERLAQRIEHRALKFRELVEEQHAEMREADLARLHLEPACGKLPFRCTKRQSRLINDAHSAALYRTFRCTASALRSGGLR